MDVLFEWAGMAWKYTLDSYGVLVALVAINLYQMAVGVALVAEHIRDRRRRRTSTPEVLATLRRGSLAAWKKHAEIVKACSLLGPALGLLISTLLSALGILEMGHGLTGGGGSAEINGAVGAFMTDVGLSYVLLVIGTLPLPVGVAALMLGGPIVRRAGPGPAAQLLGELREIRRLLGRGALSGPPRAGDVGGARPEIVAFEPGWRLMCDLDEHDARALLGDGATLHWLPARVLGARIDEGVLRTNAEQCVIAVAGPWGLMFASDPVRPQFQLDGSDVLHAGDAIKVWRPTTYQRARGIPLRRAMTPMKGDSPDLPDSVVDAVDGGEVTIYLPAWVRDDQLLYAVGDGRLHLRDAA